MSLTSLLGWQLRPIIRRRFMLQVNAPHKAFHHHDAYFLQLSAQMRRRRLRYGVLKGYATSKVLLRRVKVATAALAEQSKQKDDDKALIVGWYSDWLRFPRLADWSFQFLVEPRRARRAMVFLRLRLLLPLKPRRRRGGPPFWAQARAKASLSRVVTLDPAPRIRSIVLRRWRQR